MTDSPGPTVDVNSERGGDDGSGTSWLNRATVLGLILVVGATTALALHEASERIITLIVGIIMVASGGSELVFLVRNRGPRFWSRSIGVFAVIAAGLFLIVYPRDTLTLAAQVLGVLAIVFGAKHLLDLLRGRGPRREPRQGSAER